MTQDNKHPHCACCGPTEWDFSDENLTPELIEKKKTMSKEAFEEMMKAML